MSLNYAIDNESCLVRIKVDENVTPGALISFYEAILADDRFRPGLRFFVDRRELSTPPRAESIRAIMAYLQSRADRLGVSRMAVVVPVGSPQAPWRNAEVLAGSYTSVTLRRFDDYDEAERWVLGGD